MYVLYLGHAVSIPYLCLGRYITTLACAGTSYEVMTWRQA